MVSRATLIKHIGNELRYVYVFGDHLLIDTNTFNYIKITDTTVDIVSCDNWTTPTHESHFQFLMFNFDRLAYEEYVEPISKKWETEFRVAQIIRKNAPKKCIVYVTDRGILFKYLPSKMAYILGDNIYNNSLHGKINLLSATVHGSNFIVGISNAVPTKIVDELDIHSVLVNTVTFVNEQQIYATIIKCRSRGFIKSSMTLSDITIDVTMVTTID